MTRAGVLLVVAILGATSPAHAQPAVRVACETTGDGEARFTVENPSGIALRYSFVAVLHAGGEEWRSEPQTAILGPGAREQKAFRPFAPGRAVDACAPADVETLGPPASVPTSPRRTRTRIVFEHSLLVGVTFGDDPDEDEVFAGALGVELGLLAGGPSSRRLGGVTVGLLAASHDDFLNVHVAGRFEPGRYAATIGAGGSAHGPVGLAGIGYRGRWLRLDALVVVNGRPSAAVLVGGTLLLDKGKAPWAALAIEAAVGLIAGVATFTVLTRGSH